MGCVSCRPTGKYDNISFNLKTPYRHIPIHLYFRRYLGFRVGHKCFCFRCLLLGLNVAPRVFTKLTKPILKELRLKGVNIMALLGIQSRRMEEVYSLVSQIYNKMGFSCERDQVVHDGSASHGTQPTADKRKKMEKDLEKFIHAPLFLDASWTLLVSL